MAFEALTPHRILVCIDCYFAHHGVLEDRPVDRVPLSLIDADVEVTSGMLFEHHECGRENGEDIGECECEQVTFSWAHCDGCGSTLAGAREYMTIWLPKD